VPPDEPRRFLVAVGVEAYDDPARDRLEQVPDEVARMVDMLTGPSLGLTRIFEAESAEPRASDFVATLQSWAGSHERRPDDHLVLYWSGHGLVEHDRLILVLKATRSDALGPTGLAAEDLVDALVGEKSKLGPVLLLLDVCNAGQAVQNVAARLGPLTRSRHHKREPDIAIICASGSRDPAEPGVFVDAFIKAVRVCEERARREDTHLILQEIFDRMKEYMPSGGQQPRIHLASGRPAAFFRNAKRVPDFEPRRRADPFLGSLNYDSSTIRMDAFFPTVDRFGGGCVICFEQEDLSGCMITVEHSEILSMLFHGHHSDVDENKRAIIAHGPSDDFDRYTIQFRGARLFLREAAVRDLCTAVDFMQEIYLEALEQVDEAWEAVGRRYVAHGNWGVAVLLGTVPVWLWNSIIRFVEEHGESTEGGWPSLYASALRLRVQSTTSSQRFDSGHHASIVVADPTLIGSRAADTLAVLWLPKELGYQPHLYPLNERRHWGAATTLRWMNDELVPRVHEWMWSKQPRAVRWSLHRARRKAEFFSRLMSQGGISDLREPVLRAVDGCADLTELESLVAGLQQSFNVGSDLRFEPGAIAELYRAIILALQHVEIEYLGYVASNLSANRVRDKDELIEMLEKKIECQDLPANQFGADCGLRALSDILGAREVRLNRQEMVRVLAHLNPLVRIQHDQAMRRRHVLA
jgi:hypothetical protein